MKDHLTLLEAYKAMYAYLAWYYEHMDHPDQIGALLGDLRILNDDMPLDPAAWTDWLAAVEKVTGDQGGGA